MLEIRTLRTSTGGFVFLYTTVSHNMNGIDMTTFNKPYMSDVEVVNTPQYHHLYLNVPMFIKINGVIDYIKLRMSASIKNNGLATFITETVICCGAYVKSIPTSDFSVLLMSENNQLHGIFTMHNGRRVIVPEITAETMHPALELFVKYNKKKIYTVGLRMIGLVNKNSNIGDIKRNISPLGKTQTFKVLEFIPELTRRGIQDSTNGLKFAVIETIENDTIKTGSGSVIDLSGSDESIDATESIAAESIATESIDATESRAATKSNAAKSIVTTEKNGSTERLHKSLSFLADAAELVTRVNENRKRKFEC